MERPFHCGAAAGCCQGVGEDGTGRRLATTRAMTKQETAAAQAHAVDILIEQHNKALDLLKQLEATDDGREKRRLAQETFVAIEVHAKLEEELFYPSLRRRSDDKEFEKMLAESLEEHHVAFLLVEELKAMSTTDTRYDAKFKVLREAVEHHAKEQEEDTFPDAREQLGGDGMKLGAKMMARVMELTPPEHRSEAA
jgi:uncharacterized protein (DUF305 family)